MPDSRPGLAIVFRNSEPKREAQHPDNWILLTSVCQVRIVVCHDRGSRPRVIRREAA
jgi:hypothetical protein